MNIQCSLGQCGCAMGSIFIATKHGRAQVCYQLGFTCRCCLPSVVYLPREYRRRLTLLVVPVLPQKKDAKYFVSKKKYDKYTRVCLGKVFDMASKNEIKIAISKKIKLQASLFAILAIQKYKVQESEEAKMMCE